MKVNKTAVVTVVVVTYNSSKYVEETLRSICEQTYEAISLIVSDDCSKDDTIKICEDWIGLNGNRFVDAKIVKTPRNVGICANYNYALKFVSTEWVKFIAGDDILQPNCIEIFAKYASETSYKIFCSALIPFYEKDGVLIKKDKRNIGFECYNTPDSRLQLQNMLSKVYYVFEGPTLFVNVEILKELGCFNERYPMLEDFPIGLKFAYNGYAIGFIDEPLILYREYEASVSHSNPTFDAMINIAKRDFQMKLAWEDRDVLKWWHLYIFNTYDLNRIRKKSNLSRFLSKCLMITDVYMIMNKIRKFINR